MNMRFLWVGVMAGWMMVSVLQAQPYEIRSISDFYAPLSEYGYWVHHPQHGWCWRPANVSRDWRPYAVGRWVWTEHGWYWDSPEPWAWACYHYGRWFWDERHGWLWMPGLEWAPAWVDWRETEAYIGWAPLPPVVHVVTGPPIVIAPAAYVFVERRVFCEPDLPRWIIHHHWHHHTVIYRESRCAPPPCCGRNPCRCPRRNPSCERPSRPSREESCRTGDERRRNATEVPAGTVQVRTAPAVVEREASPTIVESPKHRRIEPTIAVHTSRPTGAPADTPTVDVRAAPFLPAPSASPASEPAHRRWQNRPQAYRPLTPSTFDEPRPTYAKPGEDATIPRIRHDLRAASPVRLPREVSERTVSHRRDIEKRSEALAPPAAVAVSAPVAEPPVMSTTSEEAMKTPVKAHRRFLTGN